MTDIKSQILTVTLNPAIDQTITISDFTPGMVNRVECMRTNPGGKGVNVASALADYGITVAATGFLGFENIMVFEKLFAQKKISDHFIRIAGQTRVGIKISDSVQAQTTDINFPGITPQPDELAAFHTQLDGLAVHNAPWIVLAGSLPPGVDPGLYGTLIEQARGRGQKVALDTSGEPLRLALNAAPDIMKPNIHELEALLDRSLETRASIVEAARHFTARGTGLVAVSMGAEGALFVTPDDVVFARPPQITAHSTVGAGDAMVAGLIAGQVQGLSLEDSARLATAFALNALSRRESGIGTPAAIRATLPTVILDQSSEVPQ